MDEVEQALKGLINDLLKDMNLPNAEAVLEKCNEVGEKLGKFMEQNFDPNPMKLDDITTLALSFVFSKMSDKLRKAYHVRRQLEKLKEEGKNGGA